MTNNNEKIVSKAHIDNVINSIKKSASRNLATLNKIEDLYSSEKYHSESNVSYLLKRNRNLTRLSLEETTAFQRMFDITLPEIIIQLLTEVGSGFIVNLNFCNNERKMYSPHVCIEDYFLNLCLNEKINPYLFDTNLSQIYDLKNNTFLVPKIQEIYESLNSERDKHLTVLLNLGSHESFITLNRANNTKLALFDVTSFSNKIYMLDGKEYEHAYYKYYEEEDISTYLLRTANINFLQKYLDPSNFK